MQLLLKKCMISLDYTGCVDFISIQEKIILPAFFKRRSAFIVSMLDSGLSGPASYLAGDVALCSWARHPTLTVPLSTQVYKWVNRTGKSKKTDEIFSKLIHLRKTEVIQNRNGLWVKLFINIRAFDCQIKMYKCTKHTNVIHLIIK